jgi:hypothetical protein
MGHSVMAQRRRGAGTNASGDAEALDLVPARGLGGTAILRVQVL